MPETVTTEQIRNWVMDDGGLAEYHDPVNGHLAALAAGRMFDKWLAAHDAEIRAAVETDWEYAINSGSEFQEAWAYTSLVGVLEDMGPVGALGDRGSRIGKRRKAGKWVPIEREELEEAIDVLQTRADPQHGESGNAWGVDRG